MFMNYICLATVDKRYDCGVRAMEIKSIIARFGWFGQEIILTSNLAQKVKDSKASVILMLIYWLWSACYQCYR